MEATVIEISMEQGRRRERGGRQARRDQRSHGSQGLGRPYIVRNIPTYDILSEENLVRIEKTADQSHAEIGISFPDRPIAIDQWKRAGAKVDGLRVRFELGLLREILKSAPAEFTQHARNPAKSVRIGGKNVVFSPTRTPNRRSVQATSCCTARSTGPKRLANPATAGSNASATRSGRVTA